MRVGVIGVGNRSGLLVDQLPESAELVAFADCCRRRPEEAAAKRMANWRIYAYRELGAHGLDRMSGLTSGARS